MKLVEGIKQKGCPFNIPDCSRSELPDFIKELGFKVGAEIGVYKGKYCEKFCQSGIKMFAIDNWSAYQFAGVTYQDQTRQDYIYDYARKVLARFDSCTIIKKDSIEAVRDFKYNTLDFVYLDGDHSFRGIADDIYEWFLRVRPGGMISGHDYSYSGNDTSARKSYETFCQVGPVVDAFVKSFKIENFYTFGRSKPIEEESKNDRYLSWMFFKP